MKNLVILLVLLFPFISKAQSETTADESKWNITFDAGLLIGHPDADYPAPFVSNISFLYNFNDRLWAGAGSGAEVIGKTFIPLFLELRAIPFKSKPLFVYNRFGGTVCATKNMSDENGYQPSTINQAHPLYENVTTRGGIMNECGMGVMLDRGQWKSTYSIGYSYQQTEDELTYGTIKTYENNFNRLVIKIGFWF